MINGWDFDNAVKKQRELLTRCPDLRRETQGPVLADLYAFGVNSLFPAKGV